MAPAGRVERTVAVVLAAKAVRSFGYGYLGVLFPLRLAGLGVGPRGLGVAVTLTLLATAGMTLALRRPAERLGARPVLVGLSGLVTVAGALLATGESPAVLVLGAMLGNLAVSTGETGPFLSIEQVLVARAPTRISLTLRMSLYNLAGYAAAGLGALTVALLARGAEAASLMGPLAWLFAASGGVQALLYRRLGPAAAALPARPAAGRPSRGLVYRIAALFALDSLAGGFVLQSLLVYWFFVRFGLDAAGLGAVFFGTQVLTAVSLLVAARVAGRLGLVNTMVFSHLASNVLLIAMAGAPSAGAAVALLLARAALSQMDVPTRQAFLMAVVRDDEREAAATVTNASRTVAQALSPTVAGAVMQAVSLSAPFVAGGALKIVYDLLLYGTCRRAERAARLRDGTSEAPGGTGRA
jgi:predicted MFS family arabinose efflux permease